MKTNWNAVTTRTACIPLVHERAMNILPSKTQGVRRRIIRYTLTWLILAGAKQAVNHFAPGTYSFAEVTYLVLVDIVTEEFVKWLIPIIR